MAASAACALALLSGCRTSPPPVALAPSPAAPTPAAAPAPDTGCAEELAAARATLAEREAALRAAEGQQADLRARLLEQSAEARSRGEREATLQAQLDEAVLEVVRAKAKLRSLESRAEAASTMAEAEAALKALGPGGAGVAREQLDKAEALLRMSAEEFEKENYGGALFLAGQAKGHLRAAEPRLANDAELLPGEVALAAPLELRVMTGANLRDGPGQEFRVLTTLPRGTAVTALSRKDRWVRVRDPHGSTGWVFEALLDLR
jgi:hypothetical protein